MEGKPEGVSALEGAEQQDVARTQHFASQSAGLFYVRLLACPAAAAFCHRELFLLGIASVEAGGLSSCAVSCIRV